MSPIKARPKSSTIQFPDRQKGLVPPRVGIVEPDGTPWFYAKGVGTVPITTPLDPLALSYSVHAAGEVGELIAANEIRRIERLDIESGVISDFDVEQIGLANVNCLRLGTLDGHSDDSSSPIEFVGSIDWTEVVMPRSLTILGVDLLHEHLSNMISPRRLQQLVLAGVDMRRLEWNMFDDLRELFLDHDPQGSGPRGTVGQIYTIKTLGVRSPELTESFLSQAAMRTTATQIVVANNPQLGQDLSFLARQGIHAVDASGTSTGDDTIKTLASEHLRELHLENTATTDEALAGLRGIPNLRRLNLAGTHVTDEGMATIARYGRRLTMLDLRGTAVTTAGVRALVNLPELANVGLPRAAVSPHLVLDTMRSGRAQHFTLGDWHPVDPRYGFDTAHRMFGNYWTYQPSGLRDASPWI